MDRQHLQMEKKDNYNYHSVPMKEHKPTQFCRLKTDRREADKSGHSRKRIEFLKFKKKKRDFGQRFRAHYQNSIVFFLSTEAGRG
ncbi:hypothetical protein MIMGU_mgv1a026790mg [Erythranthe guttata]|uniref:Uncharacterized protein n=1 Tax=Erythranthe guttata TaxID=4155 RepID=A0A022RUR5_ERYGU|nr:hypothetical protein MIMGU_mgv1a026790mg [Erythranthe guttata]